MDTNERHDVPPYTRQIDDIVFQLNGAGRLAYVDLRDGDEARLVVLDTRQTEALVRFWGEIFRAATQDARVVRALQIVDPCLGMVDDAEAEARVRALLRFLDEPPTDAA